MDNFIYLVERHQGDHDDYRVSAVKAFEEYYMAKEFIDKCNKAIRPMLDKMEEFDKKYSVGLWAFRDKFNNNTMDMLSDKEYQDYEEKKNDEYNQIIETFKYEELEFADTPIEYEIRQVLLVKK